MTKTQARAALRAEISRLLAAGADVFAVRAIVIDDGANDALWSRRAKSAAPSKRGRKAGA